MKNKYIKPSTVRVFPGQAVQIGPKGHPYHVYYLGNDQFCLINRKGNYGYGVVATYPKEIGYQEGVPISSLYGTILSGKNGKFKQYYRPDIKVPITIYPREKTK